MGVDYKYFLESGNFFFNRILICIWLKLCNIATMYNKEKCGLELAKYFKLYHQTLYYISLKAMIYWLEYDS